MKSWRMLRLELLLPAILAGCSEHEGLTVDGLPSGPSAAVGAGGLAAPSGLTATAASQTRIDLGWRDNASRESGFEVYRSTTGEFGAYTKLATTIANVRVYADDGLSAGTSYCYRVRALVRSGKNVTYSAFSNSSCTVTLVPPPPPPPPPPPIPAAASGATAVAVSSQFARVSWIDNSTNEAGFRFQRSSDGVAGWEPLAQFLYGENSTYADLPAVADQQVCYRVIAYNAGGEAAPSNAACATAPAAPSNVTATRIDAETITVGWSDNSVVEDGYQVWLVQQNCSGFCDAFDPWCDNYGQCPQTNLIAEVPANSTGFSGRHDLLALPYPYQFVYIVAKKGAGSSSPSLWAVVP